MALFSASGCACATEALLAFVGDVDWVEISQTGYCGERRRVDPDAMARVAVQGDSPVWFFVKAVHRNGKHRSICTVERGFLPQAGEAYIVQVSHLPKLCSAQVLQAAPSAEPRPIQSTRSERVSC